jgi:hypothetical protein
MSNPQVHLMRFGIDVDDVGDDDDGCLASADMCAM